MPIINTVVNEATDEEITFAKGIVKRILFKDGSPKQQQMGTVKIASIILQSEGEDDVFVRINLKKDDERVPYVEGKAGSEKWYDLQQGDEVKITISKQGVWNDKPTYETTMKRIKVTKRAEGNVNNKSSAPTKGQEKKPFVKDSSGMETGHAHNGALYLHRNGVEGSVVDLAKIVHSVTLEMKKEKSEDTGVPVTNYDLGSSVGHAVLNATRDWKESTITHKGLKEAAQLNAQVSEEILAYVKGGENRASPVKEEKQEVKKPVEKEPQFVPDDADDLPFAPLGLQYSKHSVHVLYA